MPHRLHLEQFGAIHALPILHYRMEFAHLVREAVKAVEPDCIAIELPATLEVPLRRAIERLPQVSVLTYQVSAATLDRLLAPLRSKHLRGLSGTKPGSLLRQQIPIQGEVWNENQAGFLEADSVAHCGSSLAGSFVWSLTYTDITSTWTSGRAVWNKGGAGVLEQTRQVEQSLPFEGV